jgi:hypothetical protein
MKSLLCINILSLCMELFKGRKVLLCETSVKEPQGVLSECKCCHDIHAYTRDRYSMGSGVRSGDIIGNCSENTKYPTTGLTDRNSCLQNNQPREVHTVSMWIFIRHWPLLRKLQWKDLSRWTIIAGLQEAKSRAYEVPDTSHRYVSTPV